MYSKLCPCTKTTTAITWCGLTNFYQQLIHLLTNTHLKTTTTNTYKEDDKSNIPQRLSLQHVHSRHHLQTAVLTTFLCASIVHPWVIQNHFLFFPVFFFFVKSPQNFPFLIGVVWWHQVRPGPQCVCDWPCHLRSHPIPGYDYRIPVTDISNSTFSLNLHSNPITL